MASCQQLLSSLGFACMTCVGGGLCALLGSWPEITSGRPKPMCPAMCVLLRRMVCCVCQCVLLGRSLLKRPGECLSGWVGQSQSIHHTTEAGGYWW